MRAVQGPATRVVRTAPTSQQLAVAGASISAHLPYGALLVALFLPPFFRGLFFPKEQLVALAGLLCAFGFTFFGMGGWTSVTILRTRVEWAGLAVVAAFVISTIIAINPSLALQEALKNLSYFLILWLVVNTATTPERRRGVAVSIFLTTLCVALFGVGVAEGSFTYKGAFEGGRIASTLQYPNALAAFLTPGILIGVALASVSSSNWVRAGYLGGAAVQSVVLIFTYSRGAWLMVPIVVVMLLLVTPRPQRAAIALCGLAAGAGAIAAIPWMSKSLMDPKPGFALSTLALAAVVAAMVDHITVAAVRRFGPRVRLALWAITAMGVGLGVVVVASKLPPDLAHYLTKIDLRDHSVVERWAYARDAWKMVLDRPILGWGGGGWAAAYRTYQSYGYTSTQVHNHWLQVSVETGVVGLLAALSLWVSVTTTWWKARAAQRVEPGTGAELAAVFTGAVALGGHSLIDFNLSLSAVSFHFWALLGLVASAGLPTECVRAGRRTRGADVTFLPRVVVVLVGAIALITVGTRLVGQAFGQMGAQRLNKGDLTGAKEAFERAIRLDPLTATYYVDLGQTYEALGRNGNGSSYLRKARSLIERGLELDSHNPRFHAVYASYALRNGLISQGLQALERAVELAPFEAQNYANLARAYVDVGMRYLLGQHNEQEGRKYLQKVEQVALTQQARADAPTVAGDDQRLPASTPSLNLARGQARALLGDWGKAELPLEQAFRQALQQSRARDSLAVDAGVWLALVRNRQGNAPGARDALQKAAALDSGAEKRYEELTRAIP